MGQNRPGRASQGRNRTRERRRAPTDRSTRRDDGARPVADGYRDRPVRSERVPATRRPEVGDKRGERLLVQIAEELRSFFGTLCEEYVSRQGASGFWHQLLDEPDTFEETSCTAIFAGTLARGVRQGWLEPGDRYATAARRAWDALSQDAITEGGDVNGVCEGSSYSFAREYYRSELDAVTNDLHGIGAVLVGGVELAKLERS